MNVNTNELYDLNQFSEKEIAELKKQAGDDLIPVPDDLLDAAIKKLNGEKYAKVSFNSNGKLSRFAAKERKKKRRQQKKGRKINRKNK